MDQPELSKPGFHLLLGVWHGRGVSDFPTIPRAEYEETLRVEWDDAREVFFYEQKVVLADGSPSHREFGFIRVSDDGVVDLWNAQKNGRSEVLTGTSTWDPEGAVLQLDLRSVSYGGDPRMIRSRRVITVGSDSLRYDLSMQTTTAPSADLLPHLECEMTRG